MCAQRVSTPETRLLHVQSHEAGPGGGTEDREKREGHAYRRCVSFARCGRN